MKKVAILQSNYIPWKGYFDLIAAVDEFILYDDMQFTKNDWRNRNKIKTPKGLEWLSIPVGQDIDRKICEVKVSNNNWKQKHWKSLVTNYGRANCFHETAELFEAIYADDKAVNLSEINRQFIEIICDTLGIDTTISCSADYKLIEGKTERLVNLCEQASATEYISGPAAKNYIDNQIFESSGIKLTWFDYSGYPEYPQLWGKFEHGVTILDLLFNCGENASTYMKHAKL
jgi:hypothetical protein